MSTPRTDRYVDEDDRHTCAGLLEFARELEAEIKVYRDALKIAAQRFRTMRHETAAQDIERILETT